MKTISSIFATLFLFGVSIAHAQDQVPDQPKQEQKHVQSTTIHENESGSRAMKINQDDQTDAQRREVFLDELRKLYKANFL